MEEENEREMGAWELKEIRERRGIKIRHFIATKVEDAETLP